MDEKRGTFILLDATSFFRNKHFFYIDVINASSQISTLNILFYFNEAILNNIFFGFS